MLLDGLLINLSRKDRVRIGISVSVMVKVRQYIILEYLVICLTRSIGVCFE